MNTQVKVALFGTDGEGKAIKISVQASLGALSVKGYRNPGVTLAQRNTISIWHRDGWFIPESLFRYIMRQTLSKDGTREFRSGPLAIVLDLGAQNSDPASLIITRNDEPYYIAPDTVQEIEQRLDQASSLMYSYERSCSTLTPDTNLSVMAMTGLEEGRPFRKVCLYISERYMTKRSFEHVIRSIEKSEDEETTNRSGPFRLLGNRQVSVEGHQKIDLTITDEENNILCHLSPNDVVQVRETLIRAKELLHTYSDELLKAHADAWIEDADNVDDEATTEA
jgi:hypothetical protein